MRKLILGLSLAALTAGAVALPTLANAQEGQYTTGYAGPVAGVAVGSAVGFGKCFAFFD